MRFLASLFALALLSQVQAAPFGASDSLTKRAPRLTRACGTEPSAQKVADIESRFQSERRDPTAQAEPFAVSVVWHVITDGTEGALSDATIAAQLDVLQQGFGSGYVFTTSSVNRVDNPTWFTGIDGSSDTSGSVAYDMKKSTRTGDAMTLNVWSVKFTNGLLGYATFPSEYSRRPEVDGVVILYSSFPGGTTAPYDLGQTVTHEVGHWVGLYHTFQGGCHGQGDGVADTPPQGSPTSGCPARADTCPRKPGDDPIHNFMDYSTDICMTEFTPGQFSRASSFMTTYRVGI